MVNLPFSHIILFSWDGVQYNHLMDMYEAGNLTSLRNLVNETRLPILRALITDHLTETNNAHPSMLSGVGQGETDGCPDNITIWENIENLDHTWVTGAFAGKAKFTNIIFPYAHSNVDFWFAADTSASQVTDMALTFISNYNTTNFFLFVHYREPDLAGHAYGENSSNYDNALIEVDAQLGRILSALETNCIEDSTAIVVTTDHGFEENGRSHTSPAWGAENGDPDIYTTWIACNKGSVDQTYAISNYWDQNDVAPTIYSLSGIDDYNLRWPYIRGSSLWHRVFQTRDIALTEVKPSSEVSIGGTLIISVTIRNQGNFTEIPTIVLYYNNSIIGTKSLVYPCPPLSSCGRGASVQTISFIWNTTDVSQGKYTISATASVITSEGVNQPNIAYTQDEINLQDNIGTCLVPVTVVSEFPQIAILILVVILTLLAVALRTNVLDRPVSQTPSEAKNQNLSS